jgi:thiamine-monophosphate kinase
VKKPSGITEDEVVARLARQLHPAGPGVVAGIGDDCAAVQGPRRGCLLLLKTDCVIEGRHFRPGDSAAAVGWKAVCRAVSDIAACGGDPKSALVACVVPDGRQGAWLTGLYRGIDRAALAFGFDVVGGELARTDGPAVITVSMTGEVERKALVLRSGGRPGDVLFVTGVLGGSLSSGWHLRFRPRLEQARWLVRNFRVRAMMDLSDGLAADLPRMAAAGGTGFSIDSASVPRRRGASVTAALGDGEDFELLLAVAPGDAGRLAASWRKRWPRIPLTRIGHLAPLGVREGLGEARGFDHFAR